MTTAEMIKELCEQMNIRAPLKTSQKTYKMR